MQPFHLPTSLTTRRYVYVITSLCSFVLRLGSIFVFKIRLSAGRGTCSDTRLSVGPFISISIPLCQRDFFGRRHNLLHSRRVSGEKLSGYLDSVNAARIGTRSPTRKLFNTRCRFDSVFSSNIVERYPSTTAAPPVFSPRSPATTQEAFVQSRYQRS